MEPDERYEDQPHADGDADDQEQSTDPFHQSSIAVQYRLPDCRVLV